MDTIKFSRKQYSGFKNLSYQVYVKDYVHSGDKAKRIMSDLVKQYHSEELEKIILNTILFPFDVDLYQFLEDKKLEEEAFLHASSKFHIPVEVVKEKIQEYIQYGFMDCVNKGLISYHEISEIPKPFAVETTDLEKNIKVS